MGIYNDDDVYINIMSRQNAIAQAQCASLAQIGMMRGMHQQSSADAYHNLPKTIASNASTNLLLLTIEGDAE